MNMETPDGIQLFVRKEGQGSPLVFIHGWAASHRFWKHQIEYFAKTHQVIAYDLRGHGDSEKPEHGYRVSDHVHDLVTILHKNQVANPVLIGHSLGGMIALKYSLEQSLKSRALVLVGSSPRPVASLKRSIQFSFLRFLIRLSRDRASKFTEKALFAPDVNPELVEWVNTESLRTPTHVILEILQDVKRFNVINRLSEIQIPVLILNGEFEAAVDAQMVTQMQESLPQVKVQVIVGAGHNCMLEQHSQFSSSLDLFLKDL